MSESQWWPSRYGVGDQIGSLNEITPEKVVRAASLVKTGKSYDLGRALDESIPAFPGRSFRQVLDTSAHEQNRKLEPAEQEGMGENSINWITEKVEATFQLGTHLDALNHLQIGDRSYNGNRIEDISEKWGTSRLGIETVPQIVTRGVLIDVAGFRSVEMLDEGYEITVSDVEKIVKNMSIDIEKGDAVLFNTGWGKFWMQDNETYLSGQPGPGMELAEWLVEKRIAITGCDTWSFGPVPSTNPDRPFEVPQWLNVVNGMFIVENLDTGELAADGINECMFVLSHAKVRGATAAWVSPLAII